MMHGFMLGVVLLVMVGEQAQEMQLAHWIPTTPIKRLSNVLPSWIGARSWLGDGEFRIAGIFFPGYRSGTVNGKTGRRMNGVLEPSANTLYSAKNMFKPINFYYARPDDRSVRLIGDFNGWNPNSLPMQRRVDGWWFIEVPLTHGHHQYLFLVDGTPTLDRRSSGSVQVEGYSKASLIASS